MTTVFNTLFKTLFKTLFNTLFNTLFKKNFSVFKNKISVLMPMMLMLIFIMPIFLMPMGVLFYGCSSKTESPLYVVNGKSYGVVDGVFRHRFWHYYERGVSYSEGRFFKEAIADFDQAIALRQNDQRRARTYGMHFVDYFPNREKGIALFEMGQIDEAKQNLEKSIKQFPSAKANFYLDRVRETLLKSDKFEKSYPNIVLNTVKDEIWTKDDPVILKGDIRDSSYVSGVFINGSSLFLEQATQHITLNYPLDLDQGEHKLTIQAKNLVGLESKKSITVHVDREGPLLVIESITEKPKMKESVVSATLYDEAGIKELNISNKLLSKILKNQYQTQLHFNVKVPDNIDKIVITASDLLDNKTVATISVKPKSLSNLGVGGVLVADASDLNSGVLMSDVLRSGVLNSGVLVSDVLMSDVLVSDASTVSGLVKGIFQGTPEKPKDNSPPILSIPDWEEPQTVYLEKVYIEGEATDDQKIKSITVNGVEKLSNLIDTLRDSTNEKSASVDNMASHLFFNHLVKLKSGENKIVVSATDEQGNTVNREITITRNIAEAFQSDNRLSISVMPFENKGKIPESALGFQDTIIDSLVDQNRFKMVERSKLDAILTEQKLSNEAVFDQTNAIKIGKLISSRSILAGTIVATRKGLEIVARMVDTETSEIVASKDVYGESMELPAIRELAQGLAIKFHQEFPLVSGMVIQNKGASLMLDLGESVLKPNRRVIVFREEPVVHPVTGKTLGVDNTILGYAQINQVMENMSKASMVASPASEPKALDKVITE